jgi:hypothetical protein
MEAVCSSGMLVATYQTKQSHTPDDLSATTMKTSNLAFVPSLNGICHGTETAQFAYELMFNQFKTFLLITVEYLGQKNAFLKKINFWYLHFILFQV